MTSYNFTRVDLFFVVASLIACLQMIPSGAALKLSPLSIQEVLRPNVSISGINILQRRGSGCDADLGCGQACQYKCPFSFPCDSNSDCLSNSCTQSFCDMSSKPSGGSTQTHSWEMTDFSAGFGALDITEDTYGQNNRKIVADPAGSGSKVLRITYPAKSYNPSGKIIGGTGFYATPLDLSSASTVMLEYQIYFPPNFNFVKGGKLPGLYGGRTSCSGGDPAIDCFSTRFMFRTSGLAEIYLYVDASQQVDALCQVPPLSVCNAAYGNSIGRGAWTWQTGSWQTVLQRITLNTPGKPDGRVQVFNNGVEVLDFAQVSWRNTAAVGFVGIEFETFFGGSDSSWATPTDQQVYFKGISISWT